MNDYHRCDFGIDSFFSTTVFFVFFITGRVSVKLIIKCAESLQINANWWGIGGYLPWRVLVLSSFFTLFDFAVYPELMYTVGLA